MSIHNANNALVNLTDERDKKSVPGLNLPANQTVLLPTGLKHDVMTTASNNIPTWGSSFVIDLKEKNNNFDNLVLAFNVSSIGGRTGDITNYPHYVPAYFWIRILDILLNGNVQNTHDGLEQHIINQFLLEDEDRQMVNSLAGAYNSVIQRRALASTTSTYYIQLKTLIDVCHIPILTEAHNIQLRISLNALADCVALSGGTGTATSTINSCNLISKVVRLDPFSANNRLGYMQQAPEHSIFHEIKHGLYQIPAGINTVNITMSNITGKVAFLFFVVRPNASLTMDSCYQFLPITSYSIADSTNTSVVGGQPIGSAYCLNYLNQYWSRSSYTNETAVSSNIIGNVIDNGANVYTWSYSANPTDALSTGRCLSAKQHFGSEILTLNFTGVLGAGVQVDLYAYVESLLTMSVNSVVKNNL